MAQMNMGNFNAADIDPNAFEPMVAGQYKMIMVESDVVENAKGTGMLFKYTLQVIEGPHAGKQVFGNVNFMHQNQTAQRIGQAMLSAFCRAVGIPNTPTDTEQFHNKPLLVTLSFVEATNDFKAKNEVTKVEAAQGNASTAGHAHPQTGYAAPTQHLPVVPSGFAAQPQHLPVVPQHPQAGFAAQPQHLPVVPQHPQAGFAAPTQQLPVVPQTPHVPDQAAQFAAWQATQQQPVQSPVTQPVGNFQAPPLNSSEVPVWMQGAQTGTPA